MPPKPLVDLTKIDLEQTLINDQAILEYIHQRHEMKQIDRVVAFDPEEQYTVGIRKVRDDEFWIRGHIPGRPLLPGVLLIEAAAQLGTIYYRKVMDANTDSFFGFARVDHVRFRGTIVPGDVLVLLVKIIKLKNKSMLFATQAFVEGDLVFEAEILGVTV